MAFCARYLDNLENPKAFVEVAIEEYLKSWKMNYFLHENGQGVVTDRVIPDADQLYTEEQLKNDFRIGIEETNNFMEQGVKYEVYMCQECGLQGSKQILYKHLLCKTVECSKHSIHRCIQEEEEDENENENDDELENRLSK